MPDLERDAQPLLGRLAYYLNPFDGRYEDLFKGDWRFNVFRDFTRLRWASRWPPDSARSRALSAAPSPAS